MEEQTFDGPETAAAEQRRLDELDTYDILDTPEEAAFDALADAAAAVAGTPSAAVVFIDRQRQWLKARTGLDFTETEREIAFCDRVVAEDAPLIVRDASTDPRFSAYSNVTGDPKIRFYAGFPLRSPDGPVLGSLCVIDYVPGDITQEQQGVLQTLADQVMTQLLLRRELRARAERLAERELILQRLQITEAKYRQLIEQSRDIFAQHRLDGSALYVSPAVTDILGVDPSEALDNGLGGRVHPDDMHVFVDAVERVASGENVLMVGRMHDVDGEWHYLEMSMIPVRDAAGTVTEFYSTTRDVTDRERATAELLAATEEIAQRSARMEAAERIAGFGVWNWDLTTGLVTWSEQMHRIFGTDPGTFDGTLDTYLSYVHEGDRTWVNETVGEALKHGQNYEMQHRIVRTDGEVRIFHVHGGAEFDAAGTMVRLAGTGQDVTDSVTQLAALEAANEEIAARGARMDEAQRIAGFGSWTYDIAADSISWSDQMHRIFGTDPDAFEASLEAYYERLPEEDRRRLAQALEGVYATGEPYEIEHRVIRMDGEERIFLAQGQLERDADGNPARLSGTGQDITDLRRAQNELVEARDLFVQLLSTATTTGIVGIDLEGRISIFNKGAEHLLGYTAEEMLGTTRYLDYHPAEQYEARAAYITAAVKDGADPTMPDGTDVLNCEWTAIRKDGELVTVRTVISPMRDANGEYSGSLAIMTDVTEQRRAEEERDRHAEMLRAVIENNQSEIFVLDMENRFMLVNRAYERTFGVIEAELLGRDAAELVSPELATTWAEQTRVALRDGFFREQQEADLPTGRRIYDVIKVPLYDATGNPYGICGLALDVTERVTAERAMTDARDQALAANTAKSAFLATMSHEIRTPLNAIIGITGLLLDSRLDEEQQELLTTMRGSGDQLLALINDILDFSKIEAGELDLERRPFDLRDVVEETVAQFSGTAGALELICDVDGDLPTTMIGDLTRIRQVLTNLIGNAVKFTSEGEVLVRVHRARAEDSPQDASGPGVTLTFEVKDTGIGIPADSLDRLFQSFSQVDASTTRTYGGTGLGLAISRALVTAMGGRIWVESTPGAGSTFRFTARLGLDDAGRSALARPAPEVVALRATLEGARVLIVDDNATNRRILRLQLERVGMACTDFAEPTAALADLRAGSLYDIAVLDLAMPGMDGLQLAARIRTLPGGRRLPLVLLSSIGMRLGEDQRLFSAVHTKPTRSAALLESLARVLERVPLAPTGRDQGSCSRPSEPEANLPAQQAVNNFLDHDQSRTPRSSLRVLLAEDNDVNQKVAALMLRKLGHSVELAGDGAQALAAMLAGPYDVVLMDMHMPVMDGLEATRRIRSDVPAAQQPRIVAMTASVTMEDREACAAAGMDAYLAKPVRQEQLAAVLAQSMAAEPA
ncbi:PAS domain S-box protein [Spongisporangium articulatum]|uniref:histidine kinase n=1 Tax=Spongisporangium articulatum TaxID=3362603 RepID=A0ABW8AJ54_9ACTN